MGSGIFVSTGVAAQNHAGAGVFLCFVTACCPCLFTAFCYAEFSAAIPLSGSAYSFSYVSSGELAAYMVGWNLIAEYTISAATVGRAWSGVRRRRFLRFADLLVSINLSNSTSPRSSSGSAWTTRAGCTRWRWRRAG